MAIPRSAAASAGASLMPLPIIMTGPFFRSDSTTKVFWSGLSSQSDRIDRQAPGHHLGHVAPVAGGEDNPCEAKRLEIAEQGLGPRPHPVDENQHADKPRIHRQRHCDASRRPLRVQSRKTRCADFAADEAQPADDHMMAVDAAFNALSRRLNDIAGDRELKPLASGI